MQGCVLGLVTAAGLVAGLGDAIAITQSATTAVEARGRRTSGCWARASGTV